MHSTYANDADYILESSNSPPTNPLPNRTPLHQRPGPSPQSRRPPPPHRQTPRPLARPPRLPKRHLPHSRHRQHNRPRCLCLTARARNRPASNPPHLAGRGGDRQNQRPADPRRARQLQQPVRTHAESAEPPADRGGQLRWGGCVDCHARGGGGIWHGYWRQYPCAGDV